MLRTLLFMLMLFSFVCIEGSTVYAHDLLDPAVQAFIDTNPDASPEAIRNFAVSSKPQTSLFDVPTWQQDVIGFIIGYIELGAYHIFSGVDHLLFLFAILLGATKLRSVLRYSLTFTAAHSVTLIVGGLGFFTVVSAIVEPIIAFSIAIMALLSLRMRQGSRVRVWEESVLIIFVFGLFHGLGFAGVLSDIKIPQDAFVWALLLFNVGIELAQVALIILIFPLLQLLRSHRSWTAVQLATVSAIVVISLGWTVERLFF